jgi:ribosomal protein S18 acetylase RimI-like enzyme
MSNTLVTLGPPRASDHDRVAEMVEATGVFRSDEVTVALEVFDEAVAQPGGDYHGLCAFDDETLIGFTLYGPTPCTTATWDLYWIIVDPSAHRQGVGRHLMAAAEESMQERNGQLIVVQTSSRDDYTPTRRFYESLSYDQAARISGYYAPGDDLIVYTKHLSPPATETAHYG